MTEISLVLIVLSLQKDYCIHGTLGAHLYRATLVLRKISSLNAIWVFSSKTLLAVDISNITGSYLVFKKKRGFFRLTYGGSSARNRECKA
jgi:uncharacterized membrane protein YobD (UPF0266 family)